MIFASGLSILVSIMARRPRDAILAAYGLGALWLLVPLWIEPIARYLDGVALVGPSGERVGLADQPGVRVGRREPIHVCVRLAGRCGRPGLLAGSPAVFYWMVGLQASFRAALRRSGRRWACGRCAAVRGRVRSRRRAGGRGWRRESGRSRVPGPRLRSLQNRLLMTPPDRPPCGDDPMLWKERHTSIGGGLRWLGSRPMVLFFSVLLGCYLLDVAYPVLSAP